MGSVSFDMLPYIVIEPPTNDPELLTLNQNIQLQPMITTITLVMSWEARSNLNSSGIKEDGLQFRNYTNAILNVIRTNKTILEASGYYDNNIRLIDTGTELIQGKKAVFGTFELITGGYTCQ